MNNKSNSQINWNNGSTPSEQDKTVIYGTKTVADFFWGFGHDLLEQGASRVVKSASKIFGAIGSLTTGVALDKYGGKESTGQAITSQLFSAGAGLGGGAIAAATIAALPFELPLLATGAITVGTGLLVGSIADSYVDKNYKSLKKGFREIGQLPSINIPQMSTSSQNNNQTLFEKAKLYIKNNQKADITVPTEKDLLKVSNSAVKPYV